MGANDSGAGPLNLLFNGESLVRPLTGIGQYTRALLVELEQAPGVSSIRCFRGRRLVSSKQAVNALETSERKGGAFAERAMSLLHAVASRTVFPYRAHKRAGDEAFRHAVRKLPKDTVYHEPNYILKPYDGPSVVTIHDLSIVKFPQHHPKARVAYLGDNMFRSVHAAAHVITDSEVVRAEVVDHFGVAPDKVSAIYLGVDPLFSAVSSAQALPVLERYGLEAQGYILSVSTLEPRKNLEALIDAFSRLDRSIRARFPLVIVGARGWHGAALDLKLDRLIAVGEAKRLGYVPRGDLPALYGSCRLFVFASLYEGFGLPVLEAMACRAPVLTSERTSMQEFAGEAVSTCNPVDTVSISEGIRELVEDEILSSRLARAGESRSAAFSWSSCMEKHLHIYQAVS